MKKFFIILWTILLLSSCVTGDPNVPPDDNNTMESNESNFHYSILGKYVCSSAYFSDEYFTTMHQESVPSISFYDNGNCLLMVNYLEGCCNVKGVYSVDDDKIHVQLDLEWTLFEGTDEAGLPYMDDEYIFEITDEDHLVIDRGFYSVNARDPFVRISTEPETTTEPEYDIIGKYVCSNDYYDDPTYSMTHSWPIPYIKFLKEGHCMLFVDQEGGREIWGRYRIEGNKIHVYELKFRYLEMIDEVRDNMAHEYVFTIVDEEHLTIEPGFFDVQAGDGFVKDLQGG